MGMRVYITGTTITVDKTGSPNLKIPQDRAKYLVSDTETTVLDTLLDTVTETDLTVDVQNQAGASFATTQSTIDYLATFIPRGDLVRVTTDLGATAANQETIITQNEGVISNTESIRQDAKVLKNIKEDTVENNKLLAKIYNQE